MSVKLWTYFLVCICAFGVGAGIENQLLSLLSTIVICAGGFAIVSKFVKKDRL